MATDYAAMEARGEAQVKAESAVRRAKMLEERLAATQMMMIEIADRLAAVEAWKKSCEVEIAWYVRRHEVDPPPEYDVVESPNVTHTFAPSF